MIIKYLIISNLVFLYHFGDHYSPKYYYKIQPLLNLTEVNSELFSIIFYRFLKLSILIHVTFSPTWGKEEFTHEGRKLVSGKDIG